VSHLTAGDHVALELCPQHVDCGGCQHRADVVSRFVDDHVAIELAAARKPIHSLMRGWARRAEAFYENPAKKQALLEILDELRPVVGHEDQS
jgi:hypothetical protein